MRTLDTLLTTVAAAALLAAPAAAQTLGVTVAPVTFDGSLGLYSYDYTFAVTAPAGAPLAVDNLFLSTDEVAPLNTTFRQNGAVTSNWTFADYATSLSSGLQFTDDTLSAGVAPQSPLGNGDTLEVQFSSPLAPAAIHAATATDSQFGGTFNVVTDLVAPSVPEPSPLALLAAGVLPLAARAARRRKPTA